MSAADVDETGRQQGCDFCSELRFVVQNEQRGPF